MNRIKELRLEKGIKQLELAELLSVKQQSISKYETGVLDLATDNIAKLCAFFDCTADYLLGLSSQRAFQISDEDAALVAAYHAAPESVRQGIDALLEPYKEQESKNAAAG